MGARSEASCSTGTPVPHAQFVALVLGLLAWSGIFFVFIYPPLDAFIIENVFWWVPEWFFFVEDFARYSTAALLITWAFGFAVNAIAGTLPPEPWMSATGSSRSESNTCDSGRLSLAARTP